MVLVCVSNFANADAKCLLAERIWLEEFFFCFAESTLEPLKLHFGLGECEFLKFENVALISEKARTCIKLYYVYTKQLCIKLLYSGTYMY